MAAKILLVEDDNNLREIYEARLQAEGYAIVTAKDGEEALVVAKAEKPDLVISDVMMPRISGFEMLDILRNTDELKYTKVIMLTALGQADDKTRANSLGADRYLVKSQVTLEDIVKAAHELVDVGTTPPATQPAPVASVTQMPVATPTPAPAVAPIPVAAPPSINAPAPIAATAPAPGSSAPVTPAPIAPVTPQPASAPVAPATPPAQPSAASPAPLNATSTADEQAATAKQIDQFVNNMDGQTAAVTQANPAAVADDAVLANAVSDLAASTNTPPLTSAPDPVPAPAPTVPPTPAPAVPAITGSVPIANKKVIQPLQSEPKPGLDELLAREEAKNIMGPTPAPAPNPAGMPQVGNVFGPNASPQMPSGKPNDPDPNNIAL